MSSDSLINLGVRQSTVIPCSAFSDEFKLLLSESRAAIETRRSPVSNEHFLLVLSQDCDIDNENVKYVEVLAYKAAKPREVDERVQKSRNFAKLVIQNGVEKQCFMLESKFVSCITKSSIISQIQERTIECSNVFDKHGFDIILQWLSSKLTRRPFPHAFNLAFKRLVDNGLGSFLEAHYSNIIEIYAYVSPDDDAASRYDVIIVALLSPDCSSDDKIAIEGIISSYLHQLAEDNKTLLNMMQLNGSAGNIIDNVAFVQEASDFIKSDELMLKPYTLNYLCWPDDE